MKVGSFFSGIEGFGRGAEDEGFEIAFQVEIDPACNRVLERHYPGVLRLGDITKIDPRELPAVDVACGGFPCQDLSVAGKRAGLAGERSGLFFEFMRVLAGLKPSWVVIENVPGLLSSRKGEDFATLLEYLTGYRPEVPPGGWRNSGICTGPGYSAAWRVLDAQYHGVAQRRRRVFIVGHLGAPWSAPAKVLFEPESCCWDTPPGREARKVAPAIPASGAGTSRTGNERTEADLLIPEIARAVNTQTNRLDGTVETFIAHTLRAEGADASEDGTGRGTPLVVMGFKGGAGSKAGSVGATCNLSATLQAGQEAHVMINMAVRRLTPLECTRLQGFPDDWLDIEGLSDSAKYRMTGNAVCRPVARWIFRRIGMVQAEIEG